MKKVDKKKPGVLRREVVGDKEASILEVDEEMAKANVDDGGVNDTRIHTEVNGNDGRLEVFGRNCRNEAIFLFGRKWPFKSPHTSCSA